jgi:L-ascorbate metabolism protein UlaG (beta-lactamase superfamily)
MTDPNFLHAGDHVHLGPGVTAKRLLNPSLDLEELPSIDVVLLSHYHEYVFRPLLQYPSLSKCFPIPPINRLRK